MNHYIVEQEINQRIKQLHAEAEAARRAHAIPRRRRHEVRGGGHRAGLWFVRRAAA
ncbi:MAG: hypothetical protein J2P24_20185 [Streptosporangiales bacterium]|nr:hypothetical protein [Streptosporangiales bacterium]